MHTVVKTDRAIAWVARNVASTHYDVYRADRRGARHLDRSPGIDPHSLTLRDSTVSWLDQARWRRASLR